MKIAFYSYAFYTGGMENELYPYKHNATGRAVKVLIDFLEGRD